MTFTPQEVRFIEQLRKRETSWRWLRWMFLGIGFLSVVPLVLEARRLFTLLEGLEASNWPAPSILEVAILFPKLLISLVVVVWFPIQALTHWRGDPTRVLVLRLLDSHREAGVDVHP